MLQILDWPYSKARRENAILCGVISIIFRQRLRVSSKTVLNHRTSNSALNERFNIQATTPVATRLWMKSGGS